jgi:C4-dicarboxylate-specific signal transduction histidine kinase
MTHPDDLAADEAQFNRVMAGEIDGYSLDKRWIRKNREVIDTSMAAKCMRRADGSVDYFVGLVQDITERKRAERELQAANNKIEMVLQSITDNFFGLSKDWRFTYLNKHAAEQMRILGKDPASLIGKVLWEEFPDVPNEEALRRVMSERIAVTDELYYPPLGEWVENRMYPSHDGGLVTFQRYVTNRRRAEEGLRTAQEELARVTRVMSMGELTASIAHEVNQPLAAIAANADACLRWLAKEVPDLQEVRAAVERIVRDGNRAGDVIRQIREFTRKAVPVKDRLDLNEIIRAALALARNELVGDQVSVRLELSPNLPPTLGDPVQLQQLVLKLVMNGIDAMKAVTQRPRDLVIGSDSDAADKLFVAVEDSGTGVEPHLLDRLFDPFFTTKPNGMGLGLSISRRIVEAHGGQLWATPNDNHGVTFFFTLPTGT